MRTTCKTCNKEVIFPGYKPNTIVEGPNGPHEITAPCCNHCGALI